MAPVGGAGLRQQSATELLPLSDEGGVQRVVGVVQLYHSYRITE